VSPSTPSPDPEGEFEQELAEVEQALAALKERYNQVKTDSQEQAQLQQRLQALNQQQRQQRSSEIKGELQQIKQRLEVLELNLESQLFSWNPFWQAVRFGGLGIVVGWILKSCSG
jgi:protein subunit release factor A